MANTFSEKRKTERLSLEISAQCNFNGKILEGYCLDLSPGGLRLHIIDDIPINSKVVVSLDTKPPLKLSGITKWRQKKGLGNLLGIKFLELSPEQDADLRRVIQSLFWKNFG